MTGAPPSPDSKAGRVYAVIAEFPGVKVSTEEIVVDTGLDSHTVGNHAYNLHQRGLVERDAPGRGRKARYWVKGD